MDDNSFSSKWFNALVHSSAGILVALLLWFSGMLSGIEGKTYDLRASLLAKPSPASDSIILIVVDQPSIVWVDENVGIGWPWPRELFASIITNCVRRGAESISFDILFTEDSNFGVSDDIKLKNAMLEAGSFSLGSVFPSKFSGNYQQWPEAIPRPRYTVQVDESILPAIPSYPSATFPVVDLVTKGIVLANVQHEADSDGIYRKIHPFVIFDNIFLPALGLGVYIAGNPGMELSLKPGAITVGDKVIPLDEDGKVLLNFRGGSGTYKHISAASVIHNESRIVNGDIKRDEIARDLQGKHVFFGYIAPGLHDLRPSPTDGTFSGVEINATMLDNILANDFIIPVSVARNIFMIIIFTLLATFSIALVKKQSAQIITAFVMGILPVIFAFLFFWSGYDFKIVPVQISVFTAVAISLSHRFFVIGRKERFIRHSFKHYLSPVVIDQLINNPERLKLGGERKELSLFFSDLEGFTKISEGLEPEDLTHLLNEYLTAMTDIILEEEGTVDKFEGDAIIAFWNAPLEIDNHAERAVKAALRCQQKLDDLQPYFLEQYGKQMKMRIGINTGYAIAGNMGSTKRFDYSVLGDAVNLAARLEGANKYYGTGIMISSSTYDQLGTSFHCREIGRLKVVGRVEPVTVFEPISCDKVTAGYENFKRGLDLFYKGEFEEAFKAFKCDEIDDPVSKAYCNKCLKLQNKKIETWSGVWELDTK